MKVHVAGILANQFGQLLLVTEPEQADWRLPSGALPVNTLADKAIVDIFDAQTTVKTLAIRLVGLYYLENEDSLTFVFRMGKRGGEAAATNQTGNVGFLKRTELPKNVDKQHKIWLMNGFVHDEIAPRVETISADIAPLSFLTNLFKSKSASTGTSFDVSYAVVEGDGGGLSAVIQSGNSLQLIFSDTAPNLVKQASLEQTITPNVEIKQEAPTQFQQL